MKAYKYIFGVALAGLMVGCSLNLEPISDMSELHMSSGSDSTQRVKYKDRAAMEGVYKDLYSTLKGNQEHWYLDYLLYGEARTDNAYVGTTGAEVVPVENNSLDASIPGIARDWDRYLADIAKANAIICNIDDVPDPSLTDQERKQWKAEALIFRAMMMFDLAHWFGNIPLFITEAGDITSENILEVYPQYYPKSSDQCTAYKQVAKDLREALKHAPDLNPGDKTILSKTVARALLAKVYAEAPISATGEQFQNWDSVRIFSEAVFEDGIDLAPTYHELFGFDIPEGETYETSTSGVPTMRNSVESILEMQYFAGSGSWVTWMFGRQLDKWDESFTWAKWITPSRDLMRDFENEHDSIRLNETVTYYSCGWSNYYPAEHYPFMFKCRSGLNSIIKLRGADLLLLHAEACAHLDDKRDQAIADVKRVRERVHLPELPHEKTATKEALLDAILHERRLELALEGQRLFDLIRFGKLLDVMNTINSRDEGRLPQARPFTLDHALMPIPQTALDNNSNLQQNPGY